MRPFPTKDELLSWIRDNPGKAGKRDLARAFGIKGAERLELKRLLRELADDGAILSERRQLRPSGTLPPVSVISVVGPDPTGDLLARPERWEGDAPEPVIHLRVRPKDPKVSTGDRILARVSPHDDDPEHYSAIIVRQISAGADRILGIYRETRTGGRIEPIDKKATREWQIARGQEGDAQDGILVEAEALNRSRFGLPMGRVIACHGDPSAPGMVSLIAMVQHEIPTVFPPDALAEAEAAEPIADLGAREDLRALPLLTIDPADARDHDDAIAAYPDPDAKNPGGYVVWVAIADVAHYVRPGSALDREARMRGNSTYFPDRVSPMLPETLSADLCSLRVGEERPCMAVEMTLNADGQKIGHRFCRGLMRSHASLDYVTAQEAIDAPEGSNLGAGIIEALSHLEAAYRALWAERTRREPLDLDLPERRITLNDDGTVREIGYRQRLDTHRMIEEFMILANVAAAEALESAGSPLIYRVHEEPNPEKLDALREAVKSVGLTLAKGQVLQTHQLNRLLSDARGTDEADLIAMAVLRSQTQAYYAPQNLGHFGLHLKRYAHFTSPIRRYADLIVHRGLISALDAGPDGLTKTDIERLPRTAQDISMTERRSMDAERDTVDRYVAAYLSDRAGGEFGGKIAGISRGGLFVRLDETGADGLVPLSMVGGDYYHHDRATQTLTGERTGRVLSIGQRVDVRLVEATPASGGLLLELLAVEGQSVNDGSGAGRSRHSRRKAGKRKIIRAKEARRGRRMQ